jgi:hypothetical protein
MLYFKSAVTFRQLFEISLKEMDKGKEERG